MPVSLSEWRVKIGTFNPKPRDPANQKKEDRKGTKSTKQEQDKGRRRFTGESSQNGIGVTLLILLLTFCLLNVNINWLPHDNTEGKDGHPTQHQLSCQLHGTFFSTDYGSQADSIPAVSSSQADSIEKQNQTLSSDLSSTFLVRSSGSTVCPQGQDLVTLPSYTPSTQKHVCKKTMCLSSVVSGCLDVGSSFLRGLWKLLISKLRLMRAGDIETNPGPKSTTKTKGASSVDDSTIQEAELLQLANQIDPSKYVDLGIHLGLTFAEYQRIKEKHSDPRDALMDVFTKWKQRQEEGNKREILAEALRNAELDDFAKKFLQGQFVRDQPSGSRPFSSLSEEQFAECCADIKSFYQTNLCKIRENPLDPTFCQFNDLFTNLRLLSEDGRDWQDLDYSELFNMKVNGEPPKRLMVQGEAGAGKTTLCAKIAWDWINRTNFQQFKLVLVAPLRESENFTVGEIVKSLIRTDRSVHPSQLDKYITDYQESVLIIFDGLDELKEEIPMSSKTRSMRGIQQETGIDIIQTLSAQQLATSVVMVTTRPWKADQIRWNANLKKVYTFIRVEGFTKDNLSVYIGKYFKNDETKAMNLIQFIGKSDIIAGNMTPFPIYTSMLCLMWREMEEERCRKIEQFQTFSQLFKEMFLFLKEHFILKAHENINDPSREKNLTEINDHLKSVAHIALEGLLDRNMVLNENKFEHCQVAMKTACEIGVLTKEQKLLPNVQRHESTQSPLQSIVSFPHKLFQEFVAGMHLEVLYHSNREEYIRVIEEVVLPRKEEFRYLLYFGTAQSKEVGKDIVTRMCKWSSTELEEKDIDFIVDVAFECHDRDTAKVVRSNVLSHMTSLTIDHRRTAHTLLGFMFLLTNSTELAVEPDCQLSPSIAIAETICQTTTLKEVTFVSCKMKDICFAILAEKGQGSKVQSLSLYAMDLSDSASRNLATWLCGLSDLTHLKLESMSLKDSFYQRLAEAPPLKVQSLTMEMVDLSDLASRELATWLCGLSDLTHLKLSNMSLKDSFCERLAKAPSLKVQSLTLREMILSDSALRDLSTWLCGLSDLTHLNLWNISLQDSFYKRLAKAPLLKVQSLTLVIMELSDSASRDLSTWLCGLSDLTHLKLLGSNLHCSFYERLAKAPPLKSLTLFKAHQSHMCLSDSASINLSTWLCGLSDLTHLKLSYMDLDDSFYKTLAKAPLLKVQSLTLVMMELSDSASRDLSTWLCGLSDLTHLKLIGMGDNDSFYERLVREPPLKIQSLALTTGNDNDVYFSRRTSSNLATWIAKMEHLTELSTEINDEYDNDYEYDYEQEDKNELFRSQLVIQESYLRTVRELAADQNCFRQISLGNFKYNGVTCSDIDTFIQAVRDDRNVSVPSKDANSSPDDETAHSHAAGTSSHTSSHDEQTLVHQTPRIADSQSWDELDLPVHQSASSSHQGLPHALFDAHSIGDNTVHHVSAHGTGSNVTQGMISGDQSHDSPSHSTSPTVTAHTPSSSPEVPTKRARCDPDN